MTSAFYGKAQGVVIAFDVTNRESFNALSTWIHDVREVNYSIILSYFSFYYTLIYIFYLFIKHQNAPANCAILLCATKWDLPIEFRKVSKEEYVGFALDHNMDIIETSAASGHNVNEVFITLGRNILLTNRSGLAEVHVDPNEQDKGSIILREFAASKKKKKASTTDCCTIT